MKFWKILLVALCSTAGISAASAVESDQVPIDSDTFPDPAFFRLGRAAGRGRRRLFV